LCRPALPARRPPPLQARPRRSSPGARMTQIGAARESLDRWRLWREEEWCGTSRPRGATPVRWSTDGGPWGQRRRSRSQTEGAGDFGSRRWTRAGPLGTEGIGGEGSVGVFCEKLWEAEGDGGR
jgi:hypothetical protein